MGTLTSTSEMDAELERKLRLHGQEHLILSHKKAPSPAFIRDINTIDFDEVTASYAAAANNNNDDRKVGEAGSGSASMVPIDPSYCEGVSEADPAKLERYFNLTLEAVSRGEVGLVCLAGGMVSTSIASKSFGRFLDDFLGLIGTLFYP